MVLCGFCGRIYKTAPLLLAHNERYGDSCKYYDIKLDCFKCDYLGATIDHLLMHLNGEEHLKHNKECGKCRATFKSNYHYLRHVNRKTPCVKPGEEKEYTLYNIMEFFRAHPVRITAFVYIGEDGSTNRDIKITLTSDPSKGGAGFVELIRKSFDICRDDIGVQGLESAMEQIEKLTPMFDGAANRAIDMGREFLENGNMDDSNTHIKYNNYNNYNNPFENISDN